MVVCSYYHCRDYANIQSKIIREIKQTEMRLIRIVARREDCERVKSVRRESKDISAKRVCVRVNHQQHQPERTRIEIIDERDIQR